MLPLSAENTCWLRRVNLLGQTRGTSFWGGRFYVIFFFAGISLCVLCYRWITVCCRWGHFPVKGSINACSSKPFACAITSTPLCTVSLTLSTAELVFIASQGFSGVYPGQMLLSLSAHTSLCDFILEERREFALYPWPPRPARNWMVALTICFFISKKKLFP